MVILFSPSLKAELNMPFPGRALPDHPAKGGASPYIFVFSDPCFFWRVDPKCVVLFYLFVYLGALKKSAGDYKQEMKGNYVCLVLRPDLQHLIEHVRCAQ